MFGGKIYYFLEGEVPFQRVFGSIGYKLIGDSQIGGFGGWFKTLGLSHYSSWLLQMEGVMWAQLAT